MQVVKVKKGEDMNQFKFRSKLKVIYQSLDGIIKSLNQGEYRE